MTQPHHTDRSSAANDARTVRDGILGDADASAHAIANVSPLIAFWLLLCSDDAAQVN